MTLSLATLELVLEVAAIQALVLAVLFFCRRISAATQHRLLAVAVLAVIAVTVASPFVPAQHLGIIPIEDGTARPTQPLAPVSQEAVGAVAVPGVVAAEPSPTPATPGSSAEIGTTLGTIWLAGSALALLWILGGMAYGWWLSLRTRRPENAHLADRFRMVLEQMGLRPTIPLLESERLRIPVVFGWMRPKVILPAHAAHWPEDRLRAVLLHESAHIRRGDLVRQFLAKLTCALYWFNPLAWLVERKLFLAGERAADDHVIRCDVSAADYAEHLMATSEELGVGRTPLWATAAMAEGTAFKDRIISILDPNVRRGEPDMSDRTVVTLAAAAVIVSVVALSPWRAASSMQPPPPPPMAEGTPTTAAQSAGATQNPQEEQGDFATLVAMLRMRDSDMREHAAETLGRLGDRRAVPPLVNVILEDPDASVREHACSALGDLGDPQARDPLVRVVREDRNASVREHAVVALGRLGDPGAFEVLLSVMRGDDVEEVRAHAAYALGLLGDQRALDPLLAALQEGSARMRSNAAQGLGELGDARALDALRRAEDDPSADVRRWATEAIRMIRGRR